MWFALDVTHEREAREAVEYALMEAGALGTEARDGRDGLGEAVAYFDAPPDRERVRDALTDALRIYGLASSSVREMRAREVADEDWLAEWKKNWRPVLVGRRIVVAPPWAEVADAPGRVIIRIEPGMAFGTGTHETTRLCLAAVERHFKGDSFLDVGTGTGVLAIAAAKLRPEARVEACDTDEAAVEIARENARLNGVAERVAFRAGTIEETTACASCVCANLTADVILQILPALVSASCGLLILSGILREQAPDVLARLRALGLLRHETAADGEWAAITVMT